jgi:hypothetical protein
MSLLQGRFEEAAMAQVDCRPRFRVARWFEIL